MDPPGFGGYSGLFEAAGVKRKSVVTAVGGRDVIVKKSRWIG